MDISNFDDLLQAARFAADQGPPACRQHQSEFYADSAQLFMQ